MAGKVYYNSACPVCSAGIKDQRRRMEACGIEDIEWVDVHANPEAVGGGFVMWNSSPRTSLRAFRD
jgi:hypothetical protein